MVFVTDNMALGQISLRLLRGFPCQYHATSAPLSFICHRRYTKLTDGVLLTKAFYCRVSRIAVYRTDVSIHEHCLLPEAPVLHTESLPTAKALQSAGMRNATL
jgi:hypothetical protein